MPHFKDRSKLLIKPEKAVEESARKDIISRASLLKASKQEIEPESQPHTKSKKNENLGE